MKNLTINLLAAWAATFRTFQDGDAFRESNIDLMSGDLGDRIGFLKTALDGKGDLEASNTWTENQIFEGSLTIDGDATVAGAVGTGNLTVDGDEGVNGALSYGDSAQHGVVLRYETGADAAATYNASSDHIRVPTLTGNRIWTIEDDPAPRDGAEITIYRPGNDAFTLTIRRETALGGVTTLGVFDGSVYGTWLKILFTSGHWVVGGQSANVSSLATTV